MVGKFDINVDVRGRYPREGPYYQLMCACPPCCRGGPSETMMRMWNGRGITVARELAYPAEPHPKCVSFGIWQVSCYGGH